MVLRCEYDCACLYMSVINCILVHSVLCLCPRRVGIGWAASRGFWILVGFNEQLKENCLLNLNIIKMLHGTNCNWDHCGRLSHQITFSRVNRITCSDLMLMSWFFWRATQKVHQFFQTVGHLDSPHLPQLCDDSNQFSVPLWICTLKSLAENQPSW